MKVLTVANAKSVKGGINSVVVSLLEGLKRRYPGNRFDRYPSYIDKVKPVFRVVYSLGAMLVFLVRVIPYGIVHVHSAADGSFYRKTIYTYLTKALGKKLVFHIHGSNFEAFRERSERNAKIVRKALNRADAIVVLSEQMKGLVAKFCDNPNVWVLPNPIVIPTEEEKASYQRRNDKVNLLFMGEIGPRKGIYDLVQALATLPEDCRSRLLLHVCGNNEIEKLKQVVNDLKLQDCCIVHGWTDGEKKKEFFSTSDVYILPSYAEGLPISILEAMAYSMPVISTEVGGIPEIVRTGVNGYLIQPGDIGELARSIEELVRDPEKRQVYGATGRRLVQKHDLESVLDELAEIYKALE